MRVLAIKQPWAEKIITGEKKWEIRSRRTNIHERVAIYATLTKPDQAHIDWLQSIGHGTDNLVRGYIIGTVELCGSHQLYNQEWFDKTVDLHLCPPKLYKQGSHSWDLRRAVRIKPIPYKMKRGAVVWGGIDDEQVNKARLL